MAVQAIWIADNAVMPIETIRIDADFMHIGLADEQCAQSAQAPDNRGILGCRGFAHEARAHGRAVGNLVDLVLHRYRHAVKQAERTAVTIAPGRCRCLLHQIVTIGGAKRAKRARIIVGIGDCRQHDFGHGFRPGYPLPVSLGIVGD